MDHVDDTLVFIRLASRLCQRRQLGSSVLEEVGLQSKECLLGHRCFRSSRRAGIQIGRIKGAHQVGNDVAVDETVNTAARNSGVRVQIIRASSHRRVQFFANRQHGISHRFIYGLLSRKVIRRASNAERRVLISIRASKTVNNSP